MKDLVGPTETAVVVAYNPVAPGLSSCSTSRINDHARWRVE